MTERPIKIPGPDHPISIEKSGKTWRATYKGHVIAETANALVMRETTYPPVAYFPRKDVNMELLARTDHHTYCPYKGEASYYSLSVDGAKEENAVWTYEEPYEAVKDIRERLAFYANKLDEVGEI
ncbi:MAG: DUF427 domain-containing protein [Beijerinckiaceae bacterium]